MPQTEEEYEKLKVEVYDLMSYDEDNGEKLSAEEAVRLKTIATRVSKYEDIHYPIK